MEVTVWKAVDAERGPSRLGRGRGKRAGVRYYLKGFQTGQHILQYLARCLLYFGKRSSWEENSFLPLTAVLANEQKACVVGKETNPDKQAESPRAEGMERSLHSIKHVISYCPSKKPPPKNHGSPRLSREREMHPALQFPLFRVFLTG